MNKRKNYFIDKKFQSNFIVKFCILVAATGALIMVALYALTKKATTVSVVNSRVIVQSTADFIFPVLIQTFIVATVLISLATILFTLFVSHRIAGPAFRFKKVLKTLASGDFCGECRIRKNDSLRDVAAAINDMTSDVGMALKSVELSLGHLKNKVEENADKQEVKKAVAEVDKKLRYFKF